MKSYLFITILILVSILSISFINSASFGYNYLRPISRGAVDSFSTNYSDYLTIRNYVLNGTGGGNPFDQSLNTFDSPSFYNYIGTDNGEPTSLLGGIDGVGKLELYVYGEVPARLKLVANGSSFFSESVGIGTIIPTNPLNVIGYINATMGFIVNSSTGFTGTCNILGLTSINVKGGIITSCT